MQESKLMVQDVMGYAIEKYHFGTADGPKLLVTAGIHGGEVTGIHTARRLITWLQENEANLKGQVIVLPLCNPAGFRRMQRTSPYDELDMNRIFPGSLKGTPTQVGAALVYEEAKSVDYIVDLHCCGLYGSNYTLSIYNESARDRELASMLAIPVVVESAGAAGQLFIEASRNLGKAAVIIELAGGQPLGKVDLEACEEAYQAMVGLIKQLKILDEPVVKSEPVFCGRLEAVRSIADAYFQPVVEAGVWVKEGDLLGTLDGEPLCALKDCRIMNIGPARYLFQGNGLYTFIVKA